MLNYSESTESYSIPSDNDTHHTVDYKDKDDDDDEGNDIIITLNCITLYFRQNVHWNIMANV